MTTLREGFKEARQEAHDRAKGEGWAMTPVYGGPQKKRYYLPDGREVMALPSMRDYVKREGKVVVESGTRDANYDKGWLETPPQNLKVTCIHCDRWHDTEAEVVRCGTQRNAMVQKQEQAYRKRFKIGDEDDVIKLKSEVQELREMLKKVLEKV